MACQQQPTETQFETVTSNSASVGSSQSVSQGAPSVSTELITSCVAMDTASPPACISSNVVTSVHSVPGDAVTVQVPVTVNVQVTNVNPVKTLFAPCANQTPSQPSTTPPTPTPTPSSKTPPPSPTSTPLVQSVTTPPPTVITRSSSATLPNGSVVVNTVVTTSTQAPSSVLVPSSGPAKSKVKMAPIIGGAAGGFVGLIAIVGLIYWFMKRRNRWDDIFEKDDIHENNHVRRMADRGRHLDLGAEVEHDFEPKPYQYGLIGTPAPTGVDANAPDGHQGYAQDGYQGYTPDGYRPLSADGQQWMPDGAQGYTGNGAQPRVPSSPGFETPVGQSYNMAPMAVPGATGGYYPQSVNNSSRPSSVDSTTRRPPSSTGYYRPPSTQSRATSPPGMLHGRRQSNSSKTSANSGGAYGGIEPGLYDPSIMGSLTETGSGSPVEEQRRQLMLANPSADMTRPPMGARMSMSGGSGAARRTSANVIVHQDGGRIDGGVASPPGESGLQRRGSMEKGPHLYETDNAGGPSNGGTRPPPAYSE